MHVECFADPGRHGTLLALLAIDLILFRFSLLNEQEGCAAMCILIDRHRGRAIAWQRCMVAHIPFSPSRCWEKRTGRARDRSQNRNSWLADQLRQHSKTHTYESGLLTLLRSSGSEENGGWIRGDGGANGGYAGGLGVWLGLGLTWFSWFSGIAV